MARKPATLSAFFGISVRWNLACAVVGLQLLTIASPIFAQLPLPELTSIYPPGGKQGTDIDVTIAGNDLDGVSELNFSHPGITATQKTADDGILGPQPIANQFTLKIAADVPPGIYEARAVGRFGLSNPRAFEVGASDEMMDDGSNKAVSNPREIAIGSVVNGRVDASSRDYYKVALKKGQRILVSCTAEQIDSRMDATLVIYNTDGLELARDRDSVGSDPLIDFTAPADGDYIIGLYDFIYAGGSEYFYRLSVHSRPHVDFVFPPSGLPGSNEKYTLYGRNLPGGKPAQGVTMGQVPLDQVTVNIPLPNDPTARHSLPLAATVPLRSACLDGTLFQWQSPQGVADPVTVYFAQAPVVVEQEPNDRDESAQQITVPCEYVGQFYPERDFDWVQFEANKGEVYWIDVISHRMGLDTDPVLYLQKVTKNDKGEESVSNVTTADDPSIRNTKIGTDYDTSTDDPSYRFSVTADGTYRILVRDQFGDARRDPRNVYRLVIRPEQPDFRLVAYPVPKRVANANIVPTAAAVVRKGGSSLLKVEVERRDGFQGEIEISVEGLPDGVTCQGAILGGNSSSATLIVSAAEDANAWTGSIEVVGKSKIDDTEVARTARAASAVWGTTNRTQKIPTFRLTRDLALAIVDKETAVAHVQAGEDKIWETSRGGKLEIPVKVTRRNGYKADLKLTAVDVPNEFKPKDITIKGDAADGKLALAIANNSTKPGAYTFYLKGDVKYKYARNPDAVKAQEAKQKELAAKLTELTNKQTEANAKKAAAAKAATDAANALKAADQKLAAAKTAAQKDAKNPQLADALKKAEEGRQQADTKSKEAAKGKADADKASADADALLKKAQALKKKVDTDLNNIKKANAAKDVTVSVVSTPIKLRIHNSPVKIKAQAAPGTLKQGAKLEVPVSVERLFGFEDQLVVTLEAPKGVSGLSVKSVTLPKGQTDGKFEITANDKASPGEHQFTIRAKGKFNNVNIESTEQLTLKVEEVKK